MSSRGERLSVIARRVGGRIIGTGDPIVVDATHDSRQVGAGTVFIAVRGMTSDGHAFIDRAVELGASAIVSEEERDIDVPVLLVDDSRAVMADVAAAVHQDPSHDLSVVGITGTNGKTSVAFILESILRSAGVPTGLIGTIVTRVGDDQIPTLRTTPEATDFQRLLRVMADRGANTVVTEVSSHALDLGRVRHTRFSVVAFTNLSQDHLDFHGDMDAYFEAKASLFDGSFSERAVICIDDEYGRRLANDTSIGVVTVSMGSDADITATIRHRSLAGTDISLDLPGGEVRDLSVPLIGDFNIENALVAAGCAWELGLRPDQIVSGLESAIAAPGRFEIVSGDDPLRVIVDYAHTPDGISTVIETVRTVAPGRVVAIFGAGGDRDRSKRPLMGRAASAADIVVVTSDNPRSEDPDAIIADIVAGMDDVEVRRIPDRREAIQAAILEADDGDVVLVLGKGHERSQEIGDRVLPFDDRVVARAAIDTRRGINR